MIFLNLREEQYKCNNFIYDNSTWAATTITDWDLVCDRAFYASNPPTMYMLGMAISMVLMGGVSDTYGRQRTCLACQIILVIFSWAQMGANSVAVFSFIRLVQGSRIKYINYRYINEGNYDIFGHLVDVGA